MERGSGDGQLFNLELQMALVVMTTVERGVPVIDRTLDRLMS